jgi:hypothetical protein
MYVVTRGGGDGGSLARPFPLALAPRPTPLFSVVRINAAAPSWGARLARIAESAEGDHDPRPGRVRTYERLCASQRRAVSTGTPRRAA